MLKMLGRMDVDVTALTSCGIGRTVNKLKKAESEVVQTLAKALVKKWKDLVAAQEPFCLCPGRRRHVTERALPTAGPTRRRQSAPATGARRPRRPRKRRRRGDGRSRRRGERGGGFRDRRVRGGRGGGSPRLPAEVAAEVAPAEASARARARGKRRERAPMDVDAGAAAPAPAPAPAAPWRKWRSCAVGLRALAPFVSILAWGGRCRLCAKLTSPSHLGGTSPQWTRDARSSRRQAVPRCR